MRDLEKYDELSPPVIRRVHHRGPAGEEALTYTLLWRLLLLVVLLVGLGYLIWTSGGNRNAPLSSQELSKIQTNRDIVRRDAERAAKSLGEDMDEETKVMKLIGNRQMDPFFPLLEKDRRLIHKYWGHITEGLTHREIARLMTILDMRYDQDGNVVDIPLDERNAAQKEDRLREGTKRDTEIAIDAFLDSAQSTQANQYEVEVKQENARRESRDAYKQVQKDVSEVMGESEELVLPADPNAGDQGSGTAPQDADSVKGTAPGAGGQTQPDINVDDLLQGTYDGVDTGVPTGTGAESNSLLDVRDPGTYGGVGNEDDAVSRGSQGRRPMSALERQAERERSLREDMPTSEDLDLP